MISHSDAKLLPFRALLQTGLMFSTAIPVLFFAILSFVASLPLDHITLVLVIVACAIVVLMGVLIVNYFVQRKIIERILKLVDVGRDYANGNHSARAIVMGDDELAMLGMTLNKIFEKQGGTTEKIFDLDERHQVRVYRNASQIILQVQREVPSEDDPLGTSFKVAVALSPDEAAAVASELTKG